MLLSQTTIAARATGGSQCLRRMLSSSLLLAPPQNTTAASTTSFAAVAGRGANVPSIGGGAPASVSAMTGSSDHGWVHQRQWHRCSGNSVGFASPTHAHLFSSDASSVIDATADPVENAAADPVPESPPQFARVQTGTIHKWFAEKGYGYITADKSSSDDDDASGPASSENETGGAIFLHCNDIFHTKTKPYIHNDPYLRTGIRVRYKVVPNSGGKENKKNKFRAIDLRYVDGGNVCMSNPNQLRTYMRNQKAQFGDRVFAILDGAVDQEEMELQVVQAFEKCEKQVKWARSRIEDYLKRNKNWDDSGNSEGKREFRPMGSRKVREGGKASQQQGADSADKNGDVVKEEEQKS